MDLINCYSFDFRLLKYSFIYSWFSFSHTQLFGLSVHILTYFCLRLPTTLKYKQLLYVFKLFFKISNFNQTKNPAQTGFLFYASWPYILLYKSIYFSFTAFRFSFKVGVSNPKSMDQTSGVSSKRLICSQLPSFVFR